MTSLQLMIWGNLVLKYFIQLYPDTFRFFFDLRRSYSVKHHPSYVNGDEDKETIMKRFLATFEEGDNPLAKVNHFEPFISSLT